MIIYPARDIRPFVMYCVNGKPRSSLFIESTDSMISNAQVEALDIIYNIQGYMLCGAIIIIPHMAAGI